MIESLIEDTIDAVRDNSRTDGLDLPIDAVRAARQVLEARVDPTSLSFYMLWREAHELQAWDRIYPESERMFRVSLADFIGEAAKKRMGNEYFELLHSRNEELAPTGNAE